MKKLLLPIFCIFLIASSIQAQFLKNIGFKVGGTVSQHKNEYNLGSSPQFPAPRIGLNAGIFGEFFQHPVFSLVGEINYIQRGARQEVFLTDIAHPDGTGEKMELEIDNDLLSISILAKARLESPICSPYIYIGPKADFELKRSVVSKAVFNEDLYSTTRFGYKIGVGTEAVLFGIHFLTEVVYDQDFGRLFDSPVLKVSTNAIEFKAGAFISF